MSLYRAALAGSSCRLSKRKSRGWQDLGWMLQYSQKRPCCELPALQQEELTLLLVHFRGTAWGLSGLAGLFLACTLPPGIPAFPPANYAVKDLQVSGGRAGK